MSRQTGREIAKIRAQVRDLRWGERFDALTLTGIRTVADLIAASLDEKRDRQQRAITVWILGELRARSATACLLRLLKQADQELSYYAAGSLIGIRNRSTLPILCRLAVDAPNWSCRAGAVWILRELVDPAARPVLIHALLKDSHATVRREAAVSLISYPGKRTFTALATALSDPVPAVRDVSIFAVGCLSARPGIEIVQDGLRKLVRDRSVGTWGTVGSHARDVSRAVSEALKERQGGHRGR